MLNSESRKSELSENISCEPCADAPSANLGNARASATHVLADDLIALAERVDRAGGGDASIAVTAEWQASTRRVAGKRYDVRFDSSGSSGVPPRVVIDMTLEPDEGSPMIAARVAAACCELRQRMAGVGQRELRRRTDESLLANYGVERSRSGMYQVNGQQLSAAVDDESVKTLLVTVPARRQREKAEPNYECPRCKTARVVTKKDLRESVGRWCASCRMPFVVREQRKQSGSGVEHSYETAAIQGAIDKELDAAVAAPRVEFDDSGAMHHSAGHEWPAAGAVSHSGSLRGRRDVVPEAPDQESCGPSAREVSALPVANTHEDMIANTVDGARAAGQPLPDHSSAESLVERVDDRARRPAPSDAGDEPVTGPSRSTSEGPKKRASRRPRRSTHTVARPFTDPAVEPSVGSDEDMLRELFAVSNPLSIRQIANLTGLDLSRLEAELDRGATRGLWSRVGKLWQAVRR